MDNRTKVAAIIERMASKNTSPMLRHINDDMRGRPVFPENYDWKEQVRALTAVGELLHERSADGWEELLAHFDDNRYCVTLALDGEIDWGQNFSVGDICRSEAYARFEAVLRQRKLYLGARPIAAFQQRNLSTWREERKAKSLYQLQIELCELAREKVQSPRILGLYPERAPKVDAALKIQIAELSRTKRPVLETWSLFLFYSPLTYMPKEFWLEEESCGETADILRPRSAPDYRLPFEQDGSNRRGARSKKTTPPN